MEMLQRYFDVLFEVKLQPTKGPGIAQEILLLLQNFLSPASNVTILTSLQQDCRHPLNSDRLLTKQTSWTLPPGWQALSLRVLAAHVVLLLPSDARLFLQFCLFAHNHLPHSSSKFFFLFFFCLQCLHIGQCLKENVAENEERQ